jgi:hypothetical protein
VTLPDYSGLTKPLMEAAKDMTAIFGEGIDLVE